MDEAYKADLAYIHDVGFQDFIAAAIPGLLRMLRAHGITGGQVVDIGCGPGTLARALGNLGYDVLGVDISSAMIRLARKRAPKAKFIAESFRTIKLPPCDAVTAIGEVVNYLFDRRNNREALARFFKRVHQALRPGGMFVFDVAEPGRAGQSRSLQKFSTGKDWAILVRVEEERNVLTRRMIIFRKVGRYYRRSAETHRLRLWKHGELLEDLERAGFRVQVLRAYGSIPFPNSSAGFVASKPM